MSDQINLKEAPADQKLNQAADPYSEVRSATHGAPLPGMNHDQVALNPDTVALKPFIKANKKAETLPSPAGPFNLEIIIDTSYSMEGKKIDMAKQVVRELLKQKYMQGANVGVIAYSGPHETNPKPHGDVKELPPGPITGMHGRDILNFVDDLAGNGMDPITCSLDRALERLEAQGGKKAILYIGDGGNSCRTAPCEWAQEHHLDKLNIPVFVVTPGDAQYFYDLTCIPQASGGAYFKAEPIGRTKLNIIPMDIQGDGRTTRLVPHFNNLPEDRAHAGSLDFLNTMKEAAGIGFDTKVHAEISPGSEHKGCNCHKHDMPEAK